MKDSYFHGGEIERIAVEKKKKKEKHDKEDSKQPHPLKCPCVEGHVLSHLSVLMVLIRMIISASCSEAAVRGWTGDVFQ